MDLQALFYILLLGCIYGSSTVASRFAVGQFSPTTFVALRLSLAAVGHVLIYLLAIQGRRWPRGAELWGRAALVGVVGDVVPLTSFVVAIQYTSSGVAAILISLLPLATILMAHYFLQDERLTRKKIVGVVLALGGALLLVVLGESGLPDVRRANPVGYLLVFVAILAASGMTVYARKHMREYDTFEVTSVRLFSSALVMLPAAFLLGLDLSRVDGQGYFALGWTTMVSTFFGTFVSFYAIKRFGASVAGMGDYITPVVATIGGVILLGEQVTMGMLVSMVLIITGVALANRPSRPVGVIKQIS